MPNDNDFNSIKILILRFIYIVLRFAFPNNFFSSIFLFEIFEIRICTPYIFEFIVFYHCDYNQCENSNRGNKLKQIISTVQV